MYRHGGSAHGSENAYQHHLRRRRDDEKNYAKVIGKNYNHTPFGNSLNAEVALRGGRKPLRKITTKVLEDWGIPLSLKEFNMMVDDGIIEPSEWHHVALSRSEPFAPADFFDLKEIADRIEKGYINIESYKNYGNSRSPQDGTFARRKAGW